MCFDDYPSVIKDFKAGGSNKYTSYDGETGKLVFAKTFGSTEELWYCDGGAQALALATVAAAAVSISLV